jgi:hypothetical protein
LLTISRAKIMDVLINPPLPQPATALPRRNTDRVGAAALMKSPIASSVVEKTTYRRGVNIWESRPARGVMLDIAILE